MSKLITPLWISNETEAMKKYENQNLMIPFPQVETLKKALSGQLLFISFLLDSGYSSW